MKIKTIYSSISSIALAIFLLSSCSTQKDKWINRKYHELNTHFNGYYNGRESYREGVKMLEANAVDDWDRILPVYKTGSEQEAKSIYSKMDRAIEKCTKMIKKHSMRIRGEEKNEWIDDSYMLIAKARFYKQEYLSALEAFNYVVANYPNTDMFYEAHVWLARTHLAMKNYESGIYILDAIEGRPEVPKYIRADIQAVFAQLYYEQGDYQTGVDFLMQAIPKEDDKDRRFRYTFIMAQLYQEMGSCNRAIQYYNEVAKANVPYEFEFNSKIKRAFCADAYTRNNRAIVASLEEMLEDDKNREYFDQIYYALGQIAYNAGEVEKATDRFKKSVRASIQNPKQKSLSYLRLGEIYFEETEFRTAQAYYDSAMTFLPKDYPNYSEIEVLNRNLGDLVDNLIIVEEQDSLQRLAKMSESDRNREIDKYINWLKEEEARKKREGQQGFNQMMTMRNENRNRMAGATEEGKWYFYNPTTVSFGAQEFMRIWGDRPLEDNWRRKNKQSTGGGEDGGQAQQDTIYIADENGDTIAVTKYDREYYLQGLPLTEEAMAISDSMIRDALYNIGVIYREKLDDPLKAAKAFEDLTKRFPGDRMILTIYYNLYRIYSGLKFAQETQQYKDIILNDYPESEYAKIILDPEYLEKKQSEAAGINVAYNAAYEEYQKRNYRTAIKKCDKGLSEFENHPAVAKFGFLKALCMVYKGKEEMLAALEGFVSEYKGTEEAQEAQRIIDYYTKPKDVASTGDEGSGEEELPDFSAYDTENLSGEHFFVMVVPVKGVDINQLNIALSDFNREYFELENLNVKGIFLDGQRQLITVRTLADRDKAMRYFNALATEKSINALTGEAQVERFLITTGNFATLYKDKNTELYVQLFDHFYLKNGNEPN